jgi:hypothetical protein
MALALGRVEDLKGLSGGIRFGCLVGEFLTTFVHTCQNCNRTIYAHF